MNQYQKIAFVVLRVEACLTIILALREFVEAIVYVATMELQILPKFYFNVGWSIFIGFITLGSGLLVFGLSRPLASFIGGYFDSDSSDE